ncbi:putative phosphoribosyl transferasec [mine drainage metagenome]|jgi:putative phosphoribosyl transferase|uniref:Putative phosphoribosyl transferasec n=1 Tax=mine drainage metagenome TaxID=410659 RepID=A0A1J5QTJ6_9ZZZZ
MEPHFADRISAGQALGEALRAAGPWPHALVLALPRGGVPVAREVAGALGAELDVLLVRKLGVPGQPELAMGALADADTVVLNHALIHELGIDASQVDAAIAAAQLELRRRAALWRGGRAPPAVAGRSVIVVDDGIATGATMSAALRALRTQRPARLAVAVPVAPADMRFDELADDFICLARPRHFTAVGEFYTDFHQVDDATVRALLDTDRRPS